MTIISRPHAVRLITIAALGLLASACVTAPELRPSSLIDHPEAGDRDPAPRPARPGSAGYEIEGGDFHARIVFREIRGRAVAQFDGAGFAAGAVESEFDLDQAWIRAGARVYDSAEPPHHVSVRLSVQPCETAHGVWPRTALVTVGRRDYRGCARETGPHPSWTENLPELMPAITQCLASARNSSMAFVRGSGSAHVIHAGADEEQTRVRLRVGETGRWDCVVRQGRADFTVVSERAGEAPGEGDPSFIPGHMPADGEGCYLYEAVRDDSGALIGALAHDVCGPGAIALTRLDRLN
ncbi:hypothetical protein F1654_00570 [Alkalicaulis satelles]|uniref:Uncharacterized protein n=1 Tax=Alkalicaulis satelles TaxID=2609175 RepID=A0A5M6ZMR8_9PROT|nr:hypothetical protein [Alkalicaulis satelles]KAA5804538.1 hypothetical protein F1654_00570 [Alkalicaulis satelles]